MAFESTRTYNVLTLMPKASAKVLGPNTSGRPEIDVDEELVEVRVLDLIGAATGAWVVASPSDRV